MTVLRDIIVPISVLRNPEVFGQQREGDCLRGDLRIVNGLAVQLAPAARSDRPRMLIPALTEAHCHLDKCHSVWRMGQVGGDLAAAIRAQAEDKINWTAADLSARMSRGLNELATAGCQGVRSHIDWGNTPEPPRAWSVLQNVAMDHQTITLQAAALAGIAQLADRAFCLEVAQHVSQHGGGVLGAFVLHHDASDIGKGLTEVFAAAERYGLALDFHVDEGLGPYNGLEAICDAALKTGFEGPILCGHAVSLIDQQGDDLARIIDKLLAARISICALPTTNLYLLDRQDRGDGTPDRRGLTRLRELHAAGVPVVVGSDNVADAFCPMGHHDPRAALHLACLAAHLDPPMGDWLPAITINAAQALGVEPPFIETTPMRNLRLCAVDTTAHLIAGRAPLMPIDLGEDAARLK